MDLQLEDRSRTAGLPVCNHRVARWFVVASPFQFSCLGSAGRGDDESTFPALSCRCKAPTLKTFRGAEGLVQRDKTNSNRSAGQRRFSTHGLLAFTALLLLIAPLTGWPSPPTIAEAAPDFALKSVAGDNLRLSEYRGEIVLLNFWSTRCGRCRDQLSELDTLYAEHREHGFQLLSVNIDKDQVSVNLDKDGKLSVLELNITIPEQEAISQ